VNKIENALAMPTLSYFKKKHKRRQKEKEGEEGGEKGT